MIPLTELLDALIDYCREEKNIDKRVETLRQLNAMLPSSKRLRMPSLFTNDYIQSALDKIEELISRPARRSLTAQ